MQTLLKLIVEVFHYILNSVEHINFPYKIYMISTNYVSWISLGVRWRFVPLTRASYLLKLIACVPIDIHARCEPFPLLLSLLEDAKLLHRIQGSAVETFLPSIYR